MQGNTAENQVDIDAIKGVLKQYEQSVNAADIQLAATIWSQTEDTSFIHPRGHEHGWDEIQKNFYEGTMRAPFSERKLTIGNIRVHLYQQLAWVEFYWDFAATFRNDGSPLATHGRESQLLQKTNGGWAIRHVHYSGMPVTEEREGF